MEFEFGLFCPFGILVIQGYVMAMMEESVSVLTQCLCHSLGFNCCHGSVASFRNSCVSLNSNPRSRQGRKCLIIQFSPEREFLKAVPKAEVTVCAASSPAEESTAKPKHFFCSSHQSCNPGT